MSDARLSPHRFEVRVYYEDTDLAGVVYYANYLKFTERARSEMLRAAGVDQTALKIDRGLVFVVRRVEAQYRAPARFDDLLEIETEALQIGGARLTLRQDVLRAGEPLVATTVEVALIDDAGRPTRFPADLRAALSRSAEHGA